MRSLACARFTACDSPLERRAGLLDPIDVRQVRDGRQPLVVAEPVAANRFKLKEKNSLRRGAFRAIGGFLFENLERGAKVEPTALVFRLADQVSLKRREIVLQP